MPRNPKLFLNKSVIMVTARVEEGLPFVANELIGCILWGVMAKARSMYKVKICHFLWMSNHLHMILVVDNPEDVSKFMCYIKTESSHAVNRLLGRKKRTVWTDGYDSPVILTARDVVRYIRYIYNNPTKANLVDCVDCYPGVSSWKMFRMGKSVKDCKWIRRKMIPKISDDICVKELAEKLLVEAKESYRFILEPNAWMSCFSESRNWDVSKVNNTIVELVEKSEKVFAKKREKIGEKVLGEVKLKSQSMDVSYEPKKFGKRMICICNIRELRTKFIDWFKEYVSRARSIYQDWVCGEHSTTYPPGLYVPSRLRSCNLINRYAV